MANAPSPMPTLAPSSQDPFASFQNGGAAASGNLSQGDLPSNVPSTLPASDQHYSSLDTGTNVPLVEWNPAGISDTLAAQGNGPMAAVAGANPQVYSKYAALQLYASMTPGQRAQVQQQLLDSGMYQDSAYYGATPTKKPIPGSYDPDTYAALTAAIDMAISTGQALDTVLSSTAARQASASQIYQQSTQVGQFDLSNPATLRAVADQQAQAVFGRNATDAEKALAVSMVQGAQLQYQQGKFNQTLASNRADAAVKLGGGIQAPSPATGSPGDMQAFMTAISGQESGGNYNSVNSGSGASGKYQIMPGNWSSWAAAAGLGANAPQTPQNQEIVAQNQMNQYYNDLGHNWAAVAVAWYAGESAGAAYLADPTNPKWQLKPSGGGPSIADYASSVMGRMNSAGASPQAVGIANPSPNYAYGTAGSVDPSAQPMATSGASPDPTSAPGSATTPTAASGIPTPSQLLPASTGTYTQVDPAAMINEALKKENPLEYAGNEFNTTLNAIRSMFKG